MLDDLVRKKENQMQAINDTAEYNDVQSSVMLKKALQRADIL